MMHSQYIQVEMLVLIVALWCTIPTASRVIRPPNPYKKWWLRSPNTIYGFSAWLVNPSGGVNSYGGNDGVYSSYGRPISPGTDWDHSANYGFPTGDVSGVNGSNVSLSYGRKIAGHVFRQCVGRDVGW